VYLQDFRQGLHYLFGSFPFLCGAAYIYGGVHDVHISLISLTFVVVSFSLSRFFLLLKMSKIGITQEK